jgi:probable F420-dependent oxidoreductase
MIMRFALQHAIGDPRWSAGVLEPESFAAWCRAAEAGGWEAIGFTDHPAPTRPWIESGGEGVAEPFTSLGFCAAVTQRVRLLTFVLVPAYRNPFLAAHQVATLDRLSAGRVTVGIGTGYLFGEFRALGVPPESRLGRFDEYVDIMRRAWALEDITSQTDQFAAKNVRVIPPVVQRPHPPLWIHGNSPFGTARAARYGHGWLGMLTSGGEQLARTTRTRPIPDLEALEQRIEAVRTAAAEANRGEGELEIIVAGAWPMLDVRACTPPGSFLDTIETLRTLGVDWTVSLCCGDDPGAARETVAWFGEEVIGPAGLQPRKL